LVSAKAVEKASRSAIGKARQLVVDFFKDGLKDSTMDRRERYLKHGERRVRGWLDKFSARYIWSLDAIQEVVGETGAVAIISPPCDCRSVEITALNLFGQPKELM
jgi:hypothetical protein